MTSQSDHVLVRVSASAFRRWSALGLLIVFAIIMVQIAVELPSDRLAAKAGLTAMGALLIFQAVRVWSNSRFSLELTPEGLRWTKTGEYLARIEEIEDVNTSIIALRRMTGDGVSGHPAQRFCPALGARHVVAGRQAHRRWRRDAQIRGQGHGRDAARDDPRPHGQRSRAGLNPLS